METPALVTAAATVSMVSLLDEPTIDRDDAEAIADCWMETSNDSTSAHNDRYSTAVNMLSY